MTAPDYKSNDPRGWCGNPKRGAALGRGSFHKPHVCTQCGAAYHRGISPRCLDCGGEFRDTRKDPIKLYLRRVYLNQGGYDANGTYFGHGPPLYWVADADGNVDFMIRAEFSGCDTRPGAKAAVLRLYPNARFFR